MKELKREINIINLILNCFLLVGTLILKEMRRYWSIKILKSNTSLVKFRVQKLNYRRQKSNHCQKKVRNQKKK